MREAARRTGKRVHLIQAGWFALDGYEKQFKEAGAALAPTVHHIYLDGRKADIRTNVWFAADIFTSLSDNIQETFGLTPIEGMAKPGVREVALKGVPPLIEPSLVIVG